MTQENFGLTAAFKGISLDLRSLEKSVDAPPSLLRFFTLRHGQSVGQLDITAYKRPGDALIPLTDWGRQQSEQAGKFLRQLSLNCGLGSFEIWHSTCKRTTETSKNLVKGIGDDLVVSQRADIRLDKQIFGLFSGIFDDKEKVKIYPREFHAYQAEILNRGLFFARPPGGESLEDVRRKASDFIRTFTSTAKPTVRNIIAVTHGTPALCIESELTKRNSDWVLKNIDHVPNCGIKLIENSQGSFVSRDIGHGIVTPTAKFATAQP